MATHQTMCVTIPAWVAFRTGSYADRIYRMYAAFGPDCELTTRGIGLLIGLDPEAPDTIQQVNSYRGRLVKAGLLRMEERPGLHALYHVVMPDEFTFPGLSPQYISSERTTTENSSLEVASLDGLAIDPLSLSQNTH